MIIISSISYTYGGQINAEILKEGRCNIVHLLSIYSTYQYAQHN